MIRGYYAPQANTFHTLVLIKRFGMFIIVESVITNSCNTISIIRIVQPLPKRQVTTYTGSLEQQAHFPQQPESDSMRHQKLAYAVE
ncbi:hypothetical protein [Endozoicomonas sp. GU-1]|uniref:hypothetical protein n=1 Tax=Endozoicomonas sp. GU-1 TaxID=3009078 RepID=UPI0022B482E1|nr:hypothetical protein [Endozoicomonas sp. GU-1]WBA82287.1 hypothetical protein O2T12_03760 [Endozoicomonas sp. GU-1]WBA85222.1 hypothetical protein O3276_18445 [Endozoicomonas sp. GU-1]